MLAAHSNPFRQAFDFSGFWDFCFERKILCAALRQSALAKNHLVVLSLYSQVIAFFANAVPAE